MQNANDMTVRLLIVDDSGENAEAIVSALRNSGIAVRPSRPQDVVELGQVLAAQPIDLVLAAPAQSISLAQVSQQIAASGKDVPLILLVVLVAAFIGMRKTQRNEPVSTGLAHAVGGMALINAAVAVFWH